MDEETSQEVQGVTPCSIQELSTFSHRLSACILSCVTSKRLKNDCCLFDLHGAVAAVVSALDQVGNFLDIDEVGNTSSQPPVLKDEARRALDTLIKRCHHVCRTVVLLLLKSSTADPHEADFGVTDALGDLDLLQKLSPRVLANVVRNGESSWLQPRVELCSDELTSLMGDLMLHLYIFRLAHHQLRVPRRAGRFEEELAIRAFAERFLALGKKFNGEMLERRERRFGLRAIMEDAASEGALDAESMDSVDDPEKCPSENGSCANTIVEEETSTTTGVAGSDSKAKAVHWPTPPSAAVATQKEVKQPPQEGPEKPQAISAKPKEKSPCKITKLMNALRYRAWSHFSSDAATLKALGWNGKPPQLEAWVISPRLSGIFMRKADTKELLKELKAEVKKGIQPVWNKALTVQFPVREAIDTAATKGMVSDCRRRTCLYVSRYHRYSDGRETISNTFIEHTVYFVKGKAIDTVSVTDTDGDELRVPFDIQHFWSNIWAAYYKKANAVPSTTNLLSRRQFDLVAEDDTFIHNGVHTFKIKTDVKYMIVLRPQPMHWPNRLPPPPPGYRGRAIPETDPDIIDEVPTSDDDITWEMMQELGFGGSAGENSAAVDIEVKLSDLVVRLTHAPDVEFDADVSEGVLGPLEYDSDDSSSSCSGSTID